MTDDNIVRLRGKRNIGDDFRALAARADRGEIYQYAMVIIPTDLACERHTFLTKNASDTAMLIGNLAVLQTKLSDSILATETIVSIDGKDV